MITGRNVEKNVGMGAILLTSAAYEGSALAAHVLGQILRHGNGVIPIPINEKLAIKFWKRVLSKENVDSNLIERDLDEIRSTGNALGDGSDASTLNA